MINTNEKLNYLKYDIRPTISNFFLQNNIDKLSSFELIFFFNEYNNQNIEIKYSKLRTFTKI